MSTTSYFKIITYPIPSPILRTPLLECAIIISFLFKISLSPSMLSNLGYQAFITQHLLHLHRPWTFLTFTQLYLTSPPNYTIKESSRNNFKRNNSMSTSWSKLSLIAMSLKGIFLPHIFDFVSPLVSLLLSFFSFYLH